MKRKIKTKYLPRTLVSILIIFIFSSTVPVFASDYGVGDYSECPYSADSSTCDISITNNGFSLFLIVNPSSAGSCTIQNDQVTVSTYDPAGFNLTLGDESTSSNLISVNGLSQYISPTTGTLSSPIALSNAWGYRVDGLGSFGGSTTSPETNGAPNSSIHFAEVEPSGNTPDTIDSTSTLNSLVTTTIWYGVCLNSSSGIPAGNYTSTVLYTATAN